eukprot:FR741659.1.p1 GENE.FR741659.1~~FR741659.1.p1  ORF type:complete len:255 (+),score=11.09 FR741659.1:49-813(+)
MAVLPDRLSGSKAEAGSSTTNGGEIDSLEIKDLVSGVTVSSLSCSQGVVWFDLKVHARYGEDWTVRHRYSQFLALHESARNREAITGTRDSEVLRVGADYIRLPKFPPKWASSLLNGEHWLEDRRQALDKWSKLVVKGTIQGLSSDSDFAPLMKLQRLLMAFMEVPQHAERCRLQRNQDLTTVTQGAADIGIGGNFSDCESDGLSAEEEDEDGYSECSWEDVSSEVTNFDNCVHSESQQSASARDKSCNFRGGM